MIKAAGKIGINIAGSAGQNVYFYDQLDLRSLNNSQTIVISSSAAIAIFGHLYLDDDLVLDLDGQQIEQCGGGNGSVIDGGRLALHGSIDIGQYSFTPYHQLIIEDTQELAADSDGFIRIIGNTDPALYVGQVGNLVGIDSLSSKPMGPIDLRNQKGTVSINTIIRPIGGTVSICGLASCH
jgi:hypothetical protein